jgi:hypothetical protein
VVVPTRNRHTLSVSTHLYYNYQTHKIGGIMTSKTICVIVDNTATEQTPFAKSARPSIESLVTLLPRKTLEISLDALTNDISRTYEDVVKVLSNLPAEDDKFAIKEISFSLGLDSTGEVSLVSTASGSVATQVGLTFTLIKK